MNVSNSDIESQQGVSAGKKNGRHDSDSEDETERRMSKKDRKEEKKLRKDHKQHKEQKQSKSKKEKKYSDRDENVMKVTIEAIPGKVVPICKTQPVPLSKVDFFASLAALESQKPAVGTIHTVGKKPEAEKKTGSWDCPKCSTSNLLNSHQCHKCKAMKRMTEYR